MEMALYKFQLLLFIIILIGQDDTKMTLETADINPFALGVPLESIVCYFHTFENNFEVKR